MTERSATGHEPVPDHAADKHLTRDDAVMLGVSVLAIVCSIGLLLCGV